MDNKYPDWDFDYIPCDLRLDDDAGTVVMRADPSCEPGSRDMRMIESAPRLCRLAAGLVRVKAVSDGGVATFACQGQGMDGISELAHYRSIVDKFRKVLETIDD